MDKKIYSYEECQDLIFKREYDAFLDFTTLYITKKIKVNGENRYKILFKKEKVFTKDEVNSMGLLDFDSAKALQIYLNKYLD